VRKITNQTI